MNAADHQFFLFGHPAFYDLPGRPGDGVAGYTVAGHAAPPGWLREERNVWISLRPADGRLPDQGWKVHVAAQPDTADATCTAVWDYCVARRIAFKFLRHATALRASSAKYAPRASSGKLLTVYPVDDAELHRVLTDLDRGLAGTAAPQILSDLRWKTGPLHVRYGGFRELYRTAPDGRAEAAILDPSGKLVADHRRPVFTVPDWVTPPPFLATTIAERNRGAQLPYRIHKALHFSNGGGVYLADRVLDGRTVVLKEARPLAGLDGTAADAVQRLRRERWALDRLTGLRGVPAREDYLTVDGHEFLAEEYIAGRTLHQWQATVYPLVLRADPDPEDLAVYTATALDLYQRIVDLVDRIHDRGVVLGDLHPGNIMLGDDGMPYLIDFETAHDAGDNPPAGLRTAGFYAEGCVDGRESDRYALAAIALWLFVPFNTVLALAPEKLAAYLDFAAHRFPLPASLWTSVRARLTAAADGRLLPGGCPDDEDPPSAAPMVRAVLSSADPARDDRLFPGDPAVFSNRGAGFAHGAGGVLWALSVTGRGRFPAYERWFAARARSAPPRGGFYDGLHGVAYVSDHLGHDGHALELLDRALAADRHVRAVDLTSGLAGTGLNLLHFAGRTGDRDHLTGALSVADRLAGALDGPDEACPGLGTGLLRGWCGPALLFLRAYDATGDRDLLDLAARAVRRDLDRCLLTETGALLVHRPGTPALTYLDRGSAGLALVIDELLDRRPQDELGAALPALLRACSPEITIEANLGRGRAGLIAALARVGARVPDDLRPALARHLRRLKLHAVPSGGGTAFPGEYNLRLSMDLLTGTAGVLLAVHSATTDGSTFLPFLSPRAGWCGRGPIPSAAVADPVVVRADR